MTKRYTILFSLFFAISMFTTGIAQITIDINEYPHAFGDQFHFYEVSDSTGISVNVGTPGGPQTWTFNTTDYPGGTTTDFLVVDPATTPFSNDFPTSDHSWFSADSVTGDEYIFFDLTATELHLLGIGTSTLLGDTAIVFDNPSVVAQFPIGLDSTWNDLYTISFSFDSLGITFDVVITTSTQTTIDAWGTINLPIGTYDCLRGQQLTTEIFTVYLVGIPLFSDTTNTISYTWLGENTGILAQVTSLPGETDPNFTMAEDVMFQVSGPTSVDNPDAPVAHDFELIGNYPNPFNPSTTISFTLPQAEKVVLDVYNIAGQHITTLVNQRLDAGSHEVQFNAGDLPSGIYFYRISAGQYSAVKQMVLIR